MKYPILAVFFISTFAFCQNELPVTDLTTLDGKTITVSEMIGDDDVAIISLWATWCVPCLKELDAISEVYADWQDETNVNLYAVSVDDSRTVKRVKPLINGKGWEYDIFLDTNNDFKRALGASTVPLTLLVKNNVIVYRHSGYNPGAEYELYEKVKEYSN
ncbi:MAG: TlpA family protein disulfide reductase [Bacteroidia bacterium]|nr:TlpA family protein disulfide reductase [Bacteroidia bacterium]NNF29924.1 TlpA family protein disulfide reductase [Flavobacteriaceae bacterium]MBT8275835.1 TlpA family protein disulfide reductase [Bacteroidia bacterium]NNJ81147.1 TlpA family protein disulfide reductase [Flavobacteriaceae bacterium]NNK53384.1 TlpA family protein disulfide reductase [Flavobacteriaceae bacterium]